MAWYRKMFGLEEKLNPSQPLINEGVVNTREQTYKYEQYYEQLEIVNRGVNMIVDDASSIPVMVGGTLPGLGGVVKGIKGKTVATLLNVEPNPFQDISTFRRNLLIDYLIDGNIFIYFDGVHLYHLPAPKVAIHGDERNYIKKFTFEEKQNYKPTEIIHVKENSFNSIYRGTSRLRPAKRTMDLMVSMRKFQDTFFTNGAVPGLVLKSPNTLSEKIKQRMIEGWINAYRPNSGGRRPLILDGGLDVETLGNVNFKELDFQTSIGDNENIVLKALGVPPIMMDSGNNANIRPNMRMYYLETILPIVQKINIAYERFFGFRIVEDLTNIPALQPELQDQSNYYTTLVNGGILTPNEARVNLGKDTIDGLDEIRVPANIAGSAADPSQGGRPEEPNKDDE